ncbi:hypothetical protein [Streptomyces sp. NPDC001635]
MKWLAVVAGLAIMQSGPQTELSCGKLAPMDTAKLELAAQRYREADTIGFTENAELIDFAPEGEKVRVSWTYAMGETVCERADLKNAWFAFREAVLTQLSVEHPRLAVNPVLAELSL